MTTKLKKATDEKFRKRKNSIFKKGDELRLLCGVDVYILLHRKGKYYTYNSMNQPSWPPSLEEIINTLEAYFCSTPNAKTYAGPKLPSASEKDSYGIQSGARIRAREIKYHSISSLLLVAYSNRRKSLAIRQSNSCRK